MFNHVRKAEDGYRSQIIEENMIENDENSDNNSINEEIPIILDDYLSYSDSNLDSGDETDVDEEL